MLLQFSSTGADTVASILLSWQVCPYFVPKDFSSLDNLFPLFDADKFSGRESVLLLLVAISDFLLESVLTGSVLASDFDDCASVFMTFNLCS